MIFSEVETQGGILRFNINDFRLGLASVTCNKFHNILFLQPKSARIQSQRFLIRAEGKTNLCKRVERL